MQLFAADAKWGVDALIGARPEAVEGDGKAMDSQSGHEASVWDEAAAVRGCSRLP